MMGRCYQPGPVIAASLWFGRSDQGLLSVWALSLGGVRVIAYGSTQVHQGRAANRRPKKTPFPVLWWGARAAIGPELQSSPAESVKPAIRASPAHMDFPASRR
jgi:hypothetical protein